jgi:hypothetical protein
MAAGARMAGPRYALRELVGTSRGTRLLLVHVLVAFGFVSGVVQFIGQLYPSALRASGPVTLVSLAACVIWGVTRAWPRARITHRFDRPDIRVVVEVGDIFAQETHVAIGFSDTFDTVTDDNEIIHQSSIQGQLLRRAYAGDARRLDGELQAALSHTAPVQTETAETKPKGKRARYPVGTVAVIGPPERRIFAVAHSSMGNDLVARSSVEYWWLSIARLWEAADRHIHDGILAVPLLGGGLARLDFLDRQSLLKMIILSFVARSRESLVCRELRVLIWPPDLDRIDLLEVDAFLRAL